MTAIRPLVDADIPAMQFMVAESETEGFRFLARFLREVQSGDVALDAPTEFFLGVVDDAALVAIGGVTPDPYLASADIARVRHVYVTPSARRRGVGRALMSALEARAFLRVSTLRLRTDTTAAARFYEALGYERTTEPNATHVKRR